MSTMFVVRPRLRLETTKPRCVWVNLCRVVKNRRRSSSMLMTAWALILKLVLAVLSVSRVEISVRWCVVILSTLVLIV